ncbi:hypothetical protein CSC17_4289 [Klebsiella oxytoca]|nr:hypothetical protein CSC17_4289 [Klebsiella oxytoca]
MFNSILKSTYRQRAGAADVRIDYTTAGMSGNLNYYAEARGLDEFIYE